MDSLTVGRFIAYELQTPDVAASRAFFTDVFGWTIDDSLDVSGHGPQWCRIVEAEEMAWLPFLTTPDVEETAEIAAEAGATIVAPPGDHPRFGRTAVLRDPRGAVFGIVSVADDEPPEPEGTPPPGTIAWNVLVSHDPEESLPFYMHLFGWTAEQLELDEIGRYLLCERDGALTAGIVVARPDFGTNAAWLSGVAVTDVPAATARAEQAGATLRWKNTFVPEIGRFSVVIDPVGTRIGMLEITVEGKDIR